jgi:hypothetical protein
LGALIGLWWLRCLGPRGPMDRLRFKSARQTETEAAPIRYWTELVGNDTDSKIRWLIVLRPVEYYYPPETPRRTTTSNIQELVEGLTFDEMLEWCSAAGGGRMGPKTPSARPACCGSGRS